MLVLWKNSRRLAQLFNAVSEGAGFPSRTASLLPVATKVLLVVRRKRPCDRLWRRRNNSRRVAQLSLAVSEGTCFPSRTPSIYPVVAHATLEAQGFAHPGDQLCRRRNKLRRRNKFRRVVQLSLAVSEGTCFPSCKQLLEAGLVDPSVRLWTQRKSRRRKNSRRFP